MDRPLKIDTQGRRTEFGKNEQLPDDVLISHSLYRAAAGRSYTVPSGHCMVLSPLGLVVNGQITVNGVIAG